VLHFGGFEQISKVDEVKVLKNSWNIEKW